MRIEGTEFVIFSTYCMLTFLYICTLYLIYDFQSKSLQYTKERWSEVFQYLTFLTQQCSSLFSYNNSIFSVYGKWDTNFCLQFTSSLAQIFQFDSPIVRNRCALSRNYKLIVSIKLSRMRHYDEARINLLCLTGSGVDSHIAFPDIAGRVESRSERGCRLVASVELVLYRCIASKHRRISDEHARISRRRTADREKSRAAMLDTPVFSRVRIVC